MLVATAAVALTLGVTTAAGVYAYYVQKVLNRENTIYIGNATMTLSGNEPSKAFFENKNITPYSGEGVAFTPADYSEAVAACEDGDVVTATVNVSREIDQEVYYGLSLDYSGAEIADYTYITCYTVTDGVGTPTAWAHTKLSELEPLEDTMAVGSVSYQMFISVENAAMAGKTLSFDVVLESGPAPVTAETDIAHGETESIAIDGALGTQTIVAKAWFDGEGEWKIKQGDTVLYSGSGAMDGWTSINLDNVTFTEGAASLTLEAQSGNVYLKQLQAVTLQSITVDASGATTLFEANSAFSSDGITVTAHYSDGNTAPVETGYTVSSPDMAEAGVKTVTVSYANQTASYDIAVVPAVGENKVEFTNTTDDGATLILYVTGEGQGKYLYSDSEGYQMFDLGFEYDGETYKSTFSTYGVIEKVITDYKAEDYGTLYVDLGDNEETPVSSRRFKYVGNDWLVKVMGWANAPKITGVALPEDKTYYEGDKFAAEGIVITYLGTDGQSTQVTVSAENLSSVQFLDSNGGALSGTLNAGTVNITVVYGGVYYEWSISVEKVVQTGIAVDTSAVKTVFGLNTAFTYDGLVVSAVYNNGDTEVLGSGYEVSCTDFADGKFASTGEKIVTVSADGFSATYNIEVFDYLAELDNGYESSLGNYIVFNYLTAGTVVAGGSLASSSDGNVPEGGIGYMDAAGRYIEYMFNATEAGTFDLVFELAGNNYAGPNVNDGLEDVAQFINLTIDGTPVKITEGIDLPAGTDGNIWWNLQKIVIKGISLGEGNHVIKLANANTGTSGTAHFPNVGNMTVYSDKTISHYNPYSAAKNDEYVNSGAYQYVMDALTTGVTWEENVIPEAPQGGENTRLGYFTTQGQWVQYSFTTSSEDTFDICWIVAGIGNGNSGLATLSGVIRLTIDGIPVDLSGATNFEQPAENVYWSTHKVVISDVQLAAGEHTIRAEIIKQDYGVNIENLTLNSSKPVLYAQKLDSFDSAKANDIILNADDIDTAIYLNGPSKTSDDQGETPDLNAVGGIGGCDQKGRTVEYRFNLAEEGFVDFNWRIAGSNWNDETQSNDGLDRLSKYIKFTIDGREMDLSRVTELRAGTSPWWNLVNVVIQDMYLTAGDHTVKVEVIAEKGGVNISSLTISSDKVLSKGYAAQV